MGQEPRIVSMFKLMFDTLRGKKLQSNGMLEDFGKIMQISREMLELTVEELRRPTQNPELKDKIYAMDREVSEIQQRIRRQIVEHLSESPQDEPTIGLILMSVVKDAERLGDLTKNLFEVADLLDRPLDWDEFNGLFGNLFDRLLRLHVESAAAFTSFDEAKARDLIEKEKHFKQDCNALIWNLAKQTTLKTNWAVCYGLMARHIGRIAGNLLNICTAVVMPIEFLDIHDESDLSELDF